MRKMPVIFLPHGGGPWPFTLEPGIARPSMYAPMRSYLEGLLHLAPTRPKAILLISAHWEEPNPTVQTHSHPPMLYDYTGFPAETYRVQWPAPGAPEIAGEVLELLRTRGIQGRADGNRGFDHGVFVPLKLADPEAAVPTFQLALIRGLDPAAHFALGKALAPLRERGVLIVGSGMSYHNLRRLMGQFAFPENQVPRLEDAERFDDWLRERMTGTVDARERALIEWAQAPAARSAHPREEHLLPLHVCAGAAMEDPATIAFRGIFLGAPVSAIHFGA